MSNFFRDSNLFSTRNKGSLFPGVNSNNKIKFDNNEVKLNDKKKSKIIASNVEINSLFKNKNINNEKKMKNDETESNDETQIQNKDYDNDFSKTNIKETIFNPKIDDENDEDIEITGTRDITIGNYSDTTFETSNTLHSEAEVDDLKVKGQKTKKLATKTDNLDNVSIEYLLNTIQHLSEKNKSLLNENKDLKQERENLSLDLGSKTESINLLKNKITKFKVIITNSNTLLKELKNNSIELNSKRNILAEEIKKTKDVLSKEHEFIYSLKNIVSTLKNQNSINESKINQKRQHIDVLEQKVNDLAGRLSEEKIKNSNLTKEIFSLSKKHESALFSLATENKRQIDVIEKEKNEFKSKWDEFLKFVITNLINMFLALSFLKNTNIQLNFIT